MSDRPGTSTREESDAPETDDRPRVKRKKREWLNCAGKLDRISGIHHVFQLADKCFRMPPAQAPL